MRLILTTAAFALLLPAAAHAAPGPSFDCAKASSAFEKAICADPALSKADRDLAAAYAAAQAAVPAQWKAWLKETQRSWLKFAAVECKSGDLGDTPSPARKAACRRQLFDSRIATLKHTLVTKGGRRFVSFTSYRAEAGEDEDSTSTLHITLLQIAEPADAAERGWNALMVDRLGAASTDQPAISGVAEVVIDAVAPGYIGATINETHARGPGGDSVRLEALRWSMKLGRQISPADLFKDPAAARKAIARLAMRNPEIAGDETAAGALAELLKEPHYYVLKREGLNLSFDDDNAFGGAHYAIAVLSTTIPWADLAPYLKPNLPVDLKALQNGQ
jgi:uncharacterized protein YecT (DUF1311 family)